MDRNALLAATRAEFIQGFMQAADNAMAQAKVSVYRKADFSFSQTEQRALLEVHRILQDRQPELRLHLQRNMEQLLDRSFQTTYSTFRPTFSKDFSSTSLSLVDASQFEDQLRVDEITNKFRNAADQQLRDLNIRIALLFEQNAIKERENPFRPWLFTRCIASAVEALGVRADLVALASLHLSEQMEESVAIIYSNINAYLADKGIAAQLQLKIQRTTGAGPALAGGRAETPAMATAPGTSPGLVPAAAVSITGAPEPGRFGGSLQPGVAPVSAAFPPNVLRAEAAEAASTARMHEMMQRVRHHAGGTGGAYPGTNAGAAARNGGSPAVAADGFGVTRTGSTDHTGLHWDARLSLSDSEPASVAGPGGPRVAQPADGNEDASASWLARNGLGNVMRRFLAGESSLRTFGTTLPDARIAPHFGSTVDRSVSAPLAQSIQQMLELPANAATQDPMQPVRNLILEQRAALVGATGDISEQMTIDVVAMLFEFILRDHQIPAEVRAQLGRLQFLVLKIALRESTLLTQQGHPARMLVNRIGSISIGLRQLDPSGARISTEIVRIVESLLAGDTSSSMPFSAMLDEFDNFIANEFRVGNARVERAVQVFEDAQSRNLRYTHLAAQLDDALLGLSIDAFLRDFLLHTWTFVIERAERSLDPRAIRFRHLVPELLWSIVPRTAAENRTELLDLLPNIVRTIRDGLLLLEWDLGRQQTVLDWLVAAHRSVLRGVPDALPAPTLLSLRQHFARFTTSANEAAPASTVESTDPVRQQVFLDQAIRESDGAVQRVVARPAADDATSAIEADQPAGRAGPHGLRDGAVPIQVAAGTAAKAPDTAGANTTDAARPETRTDAAAASNADALADTAMLERLRTGVAVSLKLGDIAGTAQLTWIDQQKSTLVLSIEGQPAPVLISMRMFQRMHAGGRLRFIETAPLFERAIESVQKSAESM